MSNSLLALLNDIWFICRRVRVETCAGTVRDVSAETIPGEDRFQRCQITVVAGEVVGMVSYHQALLRARVDVSYYALIEKHAR